MADTDPTPPRDEGRDRGRPTASGRRWGRILIPIAVLVVVVGVLLYMLLVAQRGTEDDSEIYQDDNGSAVVLESGVPSGMLGE